MTRGSNDCSGPHVEFGKTEDEARRWIARVDEPNARRIMARRETADLVVSGG